MSNTKKKAPTMKEAATAHGLKIRWINPILIQLIDQSGVIKFEGSYWFSWDYMRSI
jgi:hypothetical protein